MINDPGDRIRFDIKRSEIAYRVRFADPQFALSNGGRSLHFLFARLKPFGLNVSDLKLEGALGNPSSIVLSASLIALGVALRLRLDTLELEAFSPPPDAPLVEIVASTLKAVEEIAGPGYSGLATQEVTFGVHGILDMPVSSYLNRFIRTRPAGSTTSGVGFKLNGDDAKGRLSTYSVIAPSVIVPEALFVQVNAAYQGRVPTAEVRQDFEKTVRSSLEGLNLLLPEASHV